MTHIKIASSDPLSTFHSQAEVLARVLRDAGAIDGADVLDTTGSVMNAKMVAGGDADIGFMASNWVPRAVNAEDPFEAPVPVAIVAPLNAGPLFFVARADSPLSNVSELKGKAMAVGHADSGMAQHAGNMVRSFGWSEGDYEFAYISTFDGGTALKDGTVAAQLSAPIPSTHFTELTERLDIKVLQFDDAAIEKLCDEHPFYSPAIVPADFVPGLDKDTPALGVLNVVVAARDAPDDLIHKLVTAYIENAEKLEQGNALFHGLAKLIAGARDKGKAALAPGGAPLHPAAERAFRDAGYLK